MKKRILMLFVAVLVCCSLVFASACGTTESESEENETLTAYEQMEQNVESDESNASTIAHTFVGSYETTNSMGVLRSAHLINLYNDNSVEIYMGFFNDGMGGALQEMYSGTYTYEESTLKISYFDIDATEPTEFESTVSDGIFSGKIWMGASYSTYDVSYYEIDAMYVGASDDIFVGAVASDDSYTANVVSLYNGDNGSYVEDSGAFVLGTATENFSGNFSGTFEKEWGGLDEDDMILLTYDIYEVSNNKISSSIVDSSVSMVDEINYSNYNVISTSFTIGASDSQYANTLVRVK